jgi:hypothetical protein
MVVHMTYNDKVYMQWCANGGTSYDEISKASSGLENDNTWHHWVFTKDSTTGEMKIYVDNVQWLSGSGKTKTFGTFASMLIGNGTKGLLDNLQLFNYALTEDEITSLEDAVDDDYSVVVGDVLTGNVTDNDNNSTGGDVSIKSSPTKGNLTINTDGTFTYTPTENIKSATDKFTYTLGGVTEATVTIHIQGILFHYKMNEEPGSSTIADSIGNCPDSAPLPPSILLKGVSGGSELNPPDGALNKTAEITANGEAIKVNDINLYINKGVTMIGWIRPKVGENSEDNSGIMFTSDTARKDGLCLAEIGSTNNQYGDTTKIKYKWNANNTTEESNTTVEIGKWNFVAMTVDAAGTLTVYRGTDGDTAIVSDIRPGIFVNESGNKIIDFGMNPNSGQTFKGYMRDMRIYEYPLDESTLNTLFNEEIKEIVPTYEGLKVWQNGDTLYWTVTQDRGVTDYIIINKDTGDIIGHVTPDGTNSYSYTPIPAGVQVLLKVVDKYGNETIYDPTYTNISYHIKAGWNLLSVPGSNVDLTDLEAVTMGDFYRWDGSNYIPVDTTSTEPLQPGEAFWAFAPNNASVDIETLKTTNTIKMVAGWNMLGLTDTPFTIPDCVYSIYKWNSTGVIYEHSDSLIKGVGYWIFSFEDYPSN